MERVLVVCPASRDALFGRSVQSILSLERKGDLQVDVLFLIGGDGGHRWDNLCRKLEEAHRIALGAKYDALVTVDSDVIVPKDAVERMLAADADVVYGLYVLRATIGHWNVALEMDPTRDLPSGHLRLLTDDLEAAREAWGHVVPCVGHGQAISLVRRRVLRRVAFRREASFHGAPDWWFSLDCQELGVTQVADLSVVCGHIDRDPLRVLWPDPEARNLTRVEGL